jgi:hypothetical protein
MSNINTKLFVAITVVTLLSSPVAAFDTLWHAKSTQRVGEEYGFTKDAAGIMKLGNFSPDLFGPVQDYAARHLDPKQREALLDLRNQKCRSARRCRFSALRQS